jgi:hypothetical protein
MRARPGLRAAVNARLEEISFRAGLIAASIALVAVSAIGAVAVYEFALSHRAPAASATGAASAPSAPATIRTPASAPPRAQGHRTANPQLKTQPKKTQPKARQPVTAGATIPPPAAGQPKSQPSGQAASSAPAAPQDRSRGFGYTIPDGHGPWYGAHGRGPGRWRQARLGGSMP